MHIQTAIFQPRQKIRCSLRIHKGQKICAFIIQMLELKFLLPLHKMH